MKICFFVANLGDGGAQRQCIALLNLLQRDPSLDIHLILLGSGEHEHSLDTSRLTIHRTEVANFASPKALLFVIRTLRRARPDVLISWLHPADIWSYAATRVVRGIPWIMTERGSTYPDELTYNVRKQFGRRGAAAIVANSLPGKQLWDSLSPRGQTLVIPNLMLSPTTPSNPQVDRRGSGDCLFVGRLELQKNVPAMVKAFAAFATHNPTAKLVIAGKGSHRDEIERLAESEGLADRVELLGFRRDVPALVARARLFLSFSLHEGMPNALMEAVAAGLPAVVSDIPEHRLLLGPTYPHYVRLDATPEECATVIQQAWNANDQAAEIYRHAQEVLRASTPQFVAAEYIRLFNKVMEQSRRPLPEAVSLIHKLQRRT